MLLSFARQSPLLTKGNPDQTSFYAYIHTRQEKKRKSKETDESIRWNVLLISIVNNNTSITLERPIRYRLRLRLHVSKCVKSDILVCLLLFGGGYYHAHFFDGSSRFDWESLARTLQVQSSARTCFGTKEFRTICSSTCCCSQRSVRSSLKSPVNLVKWDCLGAIVTALFSRGPWLYIRMESNGQTGYIPRIICSVYKPRTMVNEKNYHHHLSISSTDSSSNRDDELDLTIMSGKGEKHFIRPYQHEQQQQQQINRYLSQSSAMINEQQKYQEHPRKHFVRPKVDERERRSTCTLPPPPPIHSTKDRRLTLNAVNWPLTTKQADVVGIHQTNDVAITTTTATTTIPPTRDTDSSSTQDSGYSESTPYFLVQHTSPDAEQPPLLMNNCKVC